MIIHLRTRRFFNSRNSRVLLVLKVNLVIRPSPAKVGTESPRFLKGIQGGIYGPIHLPYGPFSYFIVLIDASII